MKVRIGIIGGGIYGTQMLMAYNADHKRDQIELAAFDDIFMHH